MKHACAILLYTNEDYRFLLLTLACARSIRKFNDYPIFALIPRGTVCEGAKNMLRYEGIGIWEEEPVHLPGAMPYEMTKIQVAKHIEYDKVLLFDADVLVNSSLSRVFDHNAFTTGTGSLSPLNSAKVLFLPDTADWAEMHDIFRAGFTSRGWGNYGGDWNFNFAYSAQGLFYYYYGLLKEDWIKYDFPEIEHLGEGYSKWSACDLSRYSEFGIDPAWFSNPILTFDELAKLCDKCVSQQPIEN